MVPDVLAAPRLLRETEPSVADAPRASGLREGSAILPDIARRLAESYYREVWSVLRRLGVYDGLDDATQHVFMVASARRDCIRVESERAFVMSIAVRTAANLRRARQVRRVRHAETDVLAVASAVPLADELLEQRRLRTLLDEALESLSEDLRAPFVLYELEDMNLDEIAEALAIPRGTVASRLRRGRELFQTAARRLRAAGGSRGGTR